MTGKALSPIASSTWTRARARHLLNRAGFGAPLRAVDDLARLGPERAVDAFLEYERYEDTLPPPDFLPPSPGFRELRARFAGLSEDKRRELRQEMQRKERRALQQLKTWWLRRMLHSNRPLVEKMALFWHGHFATSADKVKSATHNYQVTEVFRRHGLGSFRTLVLEVARSPAMLRYLDNMQNRKGHPNENFARELMELFTLGIGHYTEDDVKEAARAFTGWTLDGDRFVFNRRQHDEGVKTVLGQTGPLGGEDVVDLLIEHPATARSISRKLWEFFVYTDPDEETVEALADTFRKSNYEIRPLLRTMFLFEEFYSDRAVATQIKSPVQTLVTLIDQLDLYQKFDAAPGPLLTLALRGMGQDLFQPPNVKGWEGNRAWINTNTLLTRYNLSAYLVNGERPAQRTPPQSLDEAGERREWPASRRIPSRTPPFDAASLFRQIEGQSVGQALDSLCDRFLGRAVASSQRTLLLGILAPGAPESAPFTLLVSSDSRLRATVHLLCSTAEYQLC